MQVLIRNEVDGYVKPAKGDDDIDEPLLSESSLEDNIDAMAVGAAIPNSSQFLKIIDAGTVIDQDQIFEIKTRRNQPLFDMDEVLPRLWLKQIPKFLIAYHSFGLFDSPKIEDVKAKVFDWEQKNAHVLARFHAVLKNIIDIVMNSEVQQLAVYWDGEGPLEIIELEDQGKRALPGRFA